MQQTACKEKLYFQDVLSTSLGPSEEATLESNLVGGAVRLCQRPWGHVSA